MQKVAAQTRLLQGLSVMVVDDNASTRRMVSDVLGAFGVSDVRLASGGAEALEMIRHQPPGLALCDWHMVPMDGIAFLKSLRRKDFGHGSTTPAIMLTAHTKPELVKAAMEAGANHFVAKPIVPANLLKRILWVLEDRREFVCVGDRYVLVESKPAETAGDPVWLVD